MRSTESELQAHVERSLAGNVLRQRSSYADYVGHAVHNSFNSFPQLHTHDSVSLTVYTAYNTCKSHNARLVTSAHLFLFPRFDLQPLHLL